jgi:hypothetical protein
MEDSANHPRKRDVKQQQHAGFLDLRAVVAADVHVGHKLQVQSLEAFVKSLKTDLAAHPSPKDQASRKHWPCVVKSSPVVSRFNQSPSACKSMEAKLKRPERTRSVDTPRNPLRIHPETFLFPY